MYSVGNFLFDQEWSIDVARGAALDLNLAFEDFSFLEFEQNMELAEECLGFKDGCLEKAQQQKIKKVVPEIKYNVVTSQYGLGQTRKADSGTHFELLDRIGWRRIVGELNGNNRNGVDENEN